MRTRIFRNTHWAVASATLLLTWPSSSFAVDAATRAAARDLGTEGVEAYEAGDYHQAMERLERAFELLPLPSLALWSARALEKNGRLLEASERYLAATRLSTEGAGDAQVQIDAQAEAEQEWEALRPRIPKLIVEIRGAPPEEAVVTVDGVTVARALHGAGRPTNPGQIEVEARWNQRVVRGKVTLRERDQKTITLDFKDATTAGPAPAQPQQSTPPDKGGVPPHASSSAATPQDLTPPRTGGSWQKPVGWVGISVGVAGLTFGGITGYFAIQQNEDLNANCPNRTCGPDQFTERWMYNNFRIMSSAGLIGGGVLTAAGLTILLTAPKKESSAYVSPYVGLSSAGVEGTF